MTVTVGLRRVPRRAGGGARVGGALEGSVRVVDGATAAQGGERSADAAITTLYHDHWTPLVRLAALLTRDASVAEEIVQDSFVALHRRWAGLADPAAAVGYLRASVINGARSALRHRGVEERHRQPGPPDPAGPEEHAVRADSDARVLAALRTLSRRQQEVLVLRYYGDFSEKDIAEALGLSAGAVKSHAHRGIAALRAALARPGDPTDEQPTDEQVAR